MGDDEDSRPSYARLSRPGQGESMGRYSTVLVMEINGATARVMKGCVTLNSERAPTHVVNEGAS